MSNPYKTEIPEVMSNFDKQIDIEIGESVSTSEIERQVFLLHHVQGDADGATLSEAVTVINDCDWCKRTTVTVKQIVTDTLTRVKKKTEWIIEGDYSKPMSTYERALLREIDAEIVALTKGSKQ